MIPEDKLTMKIILRKGIPEVVEKPFKKYIGRLVAEPKVKEEWKRFKKILKDNL